MRNLYTINRNFDRIITYLKAFLLLFLVQIGKAGFAQDPISLEYNMVELREEFSAQNEYWPYLTTMENLYVPDKDEYFMHRRNKAAAYAIITDWKNNLSEFNILTTLKLGPTTEENQTIGVIFLVQADGKGAVVFEFNKFKQYRIKQLVGSYYKFLSGETETNGWVKSGALSNKNEYNEVDIRVQLPQVDIYVNGKFLQSFDVLEYTPGNMGFLIGPDTKAKSDYFYVYTTESGKQSADEELKAEEETQSAVEQLSKIRYELEQKKRSLKECELERQKAVSVLEEEMAELRQGNERMLIQNRALQEFKNQVLVEVDEDVFLTLAENLKTEILKNQKLEAQVQVYKDSLKLTHIKYNKLKLALLDKAIKKAEKDKEIRDKQEVDETRKEIETELLDKKMNEEQSKWESENQESNGLVEEVLEEMDSEKETTAKDSVVITDPNPNSKPEVSQEPIEARPLPVKVRTAKKKED
ncbi:MAG: hypothetical protein RL266_1057 [Bacteroidota bacterium]|jgi:hypothetical protein